MKSSSYALVYGLAVTALTGLIGYGLYKVASPKNRVKSPLNLGRKWLAWVLFLNTFALLPAFFIKEDFNSVALWLMSLVVFGGLAFFLGWVYGLIHYRNDKSLASASEAIEPKPKMHAENDVFDSGEFYRLEKEGSQSFYDRGWRYFTKGSSRIFVSGAQDAIQSKTTSEQTKEVVLVPVSDIEKRLSHLKNLFDKGLITSTDYDGKRREILRDL